MRRPLGAGPVFHTTAGPLTEDQVGNVLAHHHIFVELGAVPPVAYLEADPEVVYEVIGPWLADAKALGIGTFIEFTPEGVGRRPDIVKHVADQAGLPTMLVTGIYREPFMPDWVLRRHGRRGRRFPAHRADRRVSPTPACRPASSSSPRTPPA